MPNYAYTALDAKGAEARGALQVASLNEACQRLKEMGLFPTKVVAQATSPERPKADRSFPGPPPRSVRRAPFRLRLTRTRVRPKVLATFTRQVSTLVEAGMPLLRGLRLLEEQEPNRAFKRVLANLVAAIEGGSSFSEALSAHPRVFGRLYVNMVRAGEVGGSLEIVLQRLADFTEKAQRIKGKVLSALYYPAAVLTVAMAILMGLMMFVIPRFREVFQELLGRSRMPAFTEFILAISDVVRHHIVWVLLAGLGLAGALKLALLTPQGRALFDRLKLRLPLFGPIFTKAAIARFTRTLGTLLGSGVPVLQALTIVKETAGNLVLEQAVARVHDAVKEGEAIAAPLKFCPVFPAMVVGMIDVGEQTGALPDMLLRIADTYDEEVDNAVAGMTSLLEPMLIVFLAVVVGCIVVALFLPIVSAITGIDGTGDSSGR